MPNLEFLGDDVLSGSFDLFGDDEDDDEILGDDEDEEEDLFGAAGTIRKRVSGGAFKRPGSVVSLANAKKAIRSAKMKTAKKLTEELAFGRMGAIRRKPYREIRKMPAGIDSVINVPAGATIAINFVAIVPIRPDRLVVATTCAPFFSLTRLSSQLQDNLLTGEGVPCELFTPDATGVNTSGTGFFQIEAIDVGASLQMAFRNEDTAPHRFRAAWLCAAAL